MSDTMDLPISQRPLILVDEEDRILGYEEVLKCHLGEGIRHRAFSIFIFNSQKQMLIQQRADQKLLWPGYWSNSVCSHPRQGESYLEAALRRLPEEIGIKTDLHYLYKFPYHARYKDIGSEQELCAVFYGFHDGPIQAHPDEISHWRYEDITQLDSHIEANSQLYTPWFKMEWRQVLNHHLSTIFPDYKLGKE